MMTLRLPWTAGTNGTAQPDGNRGDFVLHMRKIQLDIIANWARTVMTLVKKARNRQSKQESRWLERMKMQFPVQFCVFSIIQSERL